MVALAAVKPELTPDEYEWFAARALERKHVSALKSYALTKDLADFANTWTRVSRRPGPKSTSELPEQHAGGRGGGRGAQLTRYVPHVARLVNEAETLRWEGGEPSGTHGRKSIWTSAGLTVCERWGGHSESGTFANPLAQRLQGACASAFSASPSGKLGELSRP